MDFNKMIFGRGRWMPDTVAGSQRYAFTDLEAMRSRGRTASER
jgi:hypothetical protein